MPARFYFYDTEGKEIETELSYKVASSGGSCIAIQEENGDWVKKLFETNKGTLWARTEIGVFKDSKYNERKITINDFPGHKMVLVKEWSPVESEWFVLTSMEPGEDHGCNVPLKF